MCTIPNLVNLLLGKKWKQTDTFFSALEVSLQASSVRRLDLAVLPLVNTFGIAISNMSLVTFITIRLNTAKSVFHLSIARVT